VPFDGSSHQMEVTFGALKIKNRFFGNATARTFPYARRSARRASDSKTSLESSRRFDLLRGRQAPDSSQSNLPFGPGVIKWAWRRDCSSENAKIATRSICQTPGVQDVFLHDGKAEFEGFSSRRRGLLILTFAIRHPWRAPKCHQLMAK